MAYHEVPGGTQLFYTDAGQGRPVLMLHGWTCDGNDWSWQAPELERRYRVLIVDQRGHQQLAGQFNAVALSWLDKWLP